MGTRRERTSEYPDGMQPERMPSNIVSGTPYVDIFEALIRNVRLLNAEADALRASISALEARLASADPGASEPLVLDHATLPATLAPAPAAEATPQPSTTITLPRATLEDWYARFAAFVMTGLMAAEQRQACHGLLIEIAEMMALSPEGWGES